MSNLQTFPELNYVTFTGKVLDKGDLSLSSIDIYVIRLRIENTLTYQGGSETRKRVSEISVEAWGQLAEDVNRRVRAGSTVLVEGNLISRAFENQKKATYHRISVKASSVKTLDTRS